MNYQKVFCVVVIVLVGIYSNASFVFAAYDDTARREFVDDLSATVALARLVPTHRAAGAMTGGTQ